TFASACASRLVAAALCALAALTPAAASADVVQARRAGADGLGIMADVGVPDGVIGAITVRAHRHVALHAGGGHNSISPGLRAGVHVHALRHAVSPYVAMEGGYYFDGEANALARGLALSAGLDAETELEQMGYSFANAHLGLALGSGTAALYVQAGLSVMRARATTRESRDVAMSPASTIDVRAESVFRIWTPSGRVGLIAYF